MPLTNRRCFKLQRVSFCSRLLFQAFPLCVGMFALTLPRRVKNDRKAKDCFGLALTARLLHKGAFAYADCVSLRPCWHHHPPLLDAAVCSAHRTFYAKKCWWRGRRALSSPRGRDVVACKRAPTALPKPTPSTGAVWTAALPMGVSQASRAVPGSLLSVSLCFPGMPARQQGRGQVNGCCFHILSTIPPPTKWPSASLQNTPRNHWKEYVGSLSPSLILAQFSTGSPAWTQQ